MRRLTVTILDYGPLLDAMRGKKWVLAPHCVESILPQVKVNLFEVPGGYALPVTFGGRPNLPPFACGRCPVSLAVIVALQPGVDKAAAVTDVQKRT